MFPQRSTYRPMDGLGHGGGHGHGGGGGGHHGGGGHAHGSRGSRSGFRSGGDYIVDDGPICFCDGKPCPCPYATFEGMGAAGEQAGGAWCGTRGARPPHCQGCIAHPIYTSRLGAMGSYYANTFEQPISGLGTCPCARGPNATGSLVGDDSAYPSPGKIALACGAVAVVVMLALKIKV